MNQTAFVRFPGLADDVFREVLRELAGAREEPIRLHRALRLFRQDADWHAVLWHVARHRLVPVEDNEPLLGTLAECAALDPSSSGDIAEIVAELLGRLPDGRAHGLPGGWTRSLDELVFTVYRRDRAPFLARRAGYPPRVRRALDFVRGRVGERLADDERAEVWTTLLEDAGSTGLTRFLGLWIADEAGEDEERSLRSAGDVRALASRFGDGEAWDAGLLAEVRKNRWTRLADVLPALARLPLDELVALLLPRRMPAGDLQVVLAAREDSDERLRAAGERSPTDASGAWLRHAIAEVLRARATPPRELCAVVLASVGPQRMRIVKLIAAHTRLGVQGARAAVDAAPTELAGDMPLAAARAFAAEVASSGGALELKDIRSAPGYFPRDPMPWS